MGNVAALDASSIASFLASQIKGKKGPSAHEIAEAVAEVEHQTQTKGSSFIKVHFIDPEWNLITSGLFDRNGEGLLPEIEVEFPQHSGWRWILCACEPSNELSQPNFVATFEDAIVRKLKNKWGPKRAKPGYNIRAEFVRELCREAGVKYCIPSVEGAQERKNKERTVIAEARREAEAIKFNKKFNEEFNKKFNEEYVGLTPEGQAAVKARALKTPGIGAGAKVKVKTTQASTTQIALMNEVMGIANQLNVGQLATEALIEACVDENDFTNSPGGGGESTGLLQVIPSTAKAAGIDPLNVGQTVTVFLTSEKYHGIPGGAKGYAKAHPTATAGEVAAAQQGNLASASVYN